MDSVPAFPTERHYLLVRHDSSTGDYFTTVGGQYNYNSDSDSPAEERIFSKLGDLINNSDQYRNKDGLMHFRICYPGLQSVKYTMALAPSSA